MRKARALPLRRNGQRKRETWDSVTHGHVSGALYPYYSIGGMPNYGIPVRKKNIYIKCELNEGEGELVNN